MNHAADSVLRHAVRVAVIARRLGQFALLLATLSLVPALFAWFAGDPTAAARFAIVIVGLVALGAPLARRDAPASIQVNEALVLSALAFALAPLAMTYPVMGAGIGFADALFECVSGITTTGLSTLGSVEHRPIAFLFARAWMQWIGGLGIVVLSVALLAGDDVAARRLVASPFSPDTLDSSTRLYARRVTGIYAVLTIAAIGLLWILGWSAFDALVLGLAAISTGGFAPHDAGLAASPWWSARLAVIGVAMLGAVSLPLFRLAWQRRWGMLARDPELRLLFASCALVTVVLMLQMMRAQGGWSPALFADALATASSAQTTSGFSSLPIDRLDPASLLVLMIAMAVGGSVGSTAGGIKLLRLLLLVRMVQQVLRRSAMPRHAVSNLRLHGRPVSAEEMSGALMLALLFVAAVVLSWLVFLMRGQPPLNSLFEVVSALGTVGLSAGVSGPGLDPWLKGVLCADMLMGRVEFVAVLVMLYPGTWIGRRAAP